jgi:MFS family permease
MLTLVAFTAAVAAGSLVAGWLLGRAMHRRARHAGWSRGRTVAITAATFAVGSAAVVVLGR